ncbi:hypothetical protein SEA_BACHOME_84 [Mycobacterium phage Bachome]|nr:hypothetical protein SEA_BACHOME_84 [Mycobacterium phage Bachome]
MLDGKLKKMQDKVAKLLRQAEDVAGTPEEAIFQGKAFEIMAKYGLEMSQVEAAKQGLDVTEMPGAIQWTTRIEGKYIAQQALLLHGIARALHCSTVYTDSKINGYILHVFGMEHHVDRVKMLWGILRPQMLRLVGKVRPAEGFREVYVQDHWGDVRKKSTAGQLKKYRRAWIAGFAQTIAERVREQENKAIEGAGGGALVLYRGDKERADLALREAFPRVRVTKPRASYDMNGYAHGRRDGRNALMQHSLAS